MITNIELILLIWIMPVIPVYFAINNSFISFGESAGTVVAAAILWPLCFVMIVFLAVIYYSGKVIDTLSYLMYLLAKAVTRR